jgi:hypothetical protein
MRTLLILALFVAGVATTENIAAARGRSVAPNGQVVHSRRAPVVLHRAVPPFHGVHVYGGR